MFSLQQNNNNNNVNSKEAFESAFVVILPGIIVNVRSVAWIIKGEGKEGQLEAKRKRTN